MGDNVSAIEQIRASRQARMARTETVDVPEWGVAVTIRPLTRAEVRKFGSMGPEDAEVFAWLSAVTDPVLSEDEVRELFAEDGYGPLEKVLERILELAGLGGRFRAGNEGGDS